VAISGPETTFFGRDLDTFLTQGEETMHKQNVQKVAVIRRFPRISSKQEFALLEKRVIDLLTRPLEWRIELGHTFNRLKVSGKLSGKIKHGEWKHYFRKTFTEPFDITLRTGENYMRLAREDAAKPKNENGSLMEEATDEDAVAVKRASDREQAAVRPKQQGKARLDAMFKKLTYELLHSTKWEKAEPKLLKILHQLYAEFEISDEEATNETVAA
jgi:hypothetical protein